MLEDDGHHGKEVRERIRHVLGKEEWGFMQMKSVHLAMEKELSDIRWEEEEEYQVVVGCIGEEYMQFIAGEDVSTPLILQSLRYIIGLYLGIGDSLEIARVSEKYCTLLKDYSKSVPADFAFLMECIAISASQQGYQENVAHPLVMRWIQSIHPCSYSRVLPILEQEFVKDNTLYLGNIRSLLNDLYNPSDTRKDVECTPYFLRDACSILADNGLLPLEISAAITSWIQLISAISREQQITTKLVTTIASQLVKHLLLDILEQCETSCRLLGLKFPPQESFHVLIQGSLARLEHTSFQNVSLSLIAQDDLQFSTSFQCLFGLFSVSLAALGDFHMYPVPCEQLFTSRHNPLSGLFIDPYNFVLDSKGHLSQIFTPLSFKDHLLNHSRNGLSVSVLQRPGQKLQQHLLKEAFTLVDIADLGNKLYKQLSLLIKESKTNSSPLLIIDSLSLLHSLVSLKNPDLTIEYPSSWSDSLSFLSLPYLFHDQISALLNQFTSKLITESLPLTYKPPERCSTCIITPFWSSLSSFCKSRRTSRLHEHLAWITSHVQYSKLEWTSAFPENPKQEDVQFIGAFSGSIHLSKLLSQTLSEWVSLEAPEKSIISDGYRFTLFPQTPGASDCVFLIDQIIFGDLAHKLVPCGELFRLSHNSHSFPVYVQEHPQGSELTQPYPSFSRQDYSRLFILTIILQIHHISPNQLSVDPLGALSFSAPYHIFTSPNAKPTNIVYYLQPFLHPIDQLIRKRILSIDVYESLEAWLLALSVSNADNTSPSLFSPGELEFLLGQFCRPLSTRTSCSCIPLLLGRGALFHIADTLLSLQQLLRDCPLMTHAQLLQTIYPSLALTYRSTAYHNIPPSASNILQSALAVLPRPPSQSLEIPQQLWSLVSPAALLSVLSQLQSIPALIPSIQEQLVLGQTIDLDTLMITHYQQQLLETIPLPSLSTFATQTLVRSFPSFLPLRGLSLQGSQDLDVDALTVLLQACPKITHLDVSYCTQLQMKAGNLFSLLTSMVPFLLNLVLDGLELGPLKSSSWNKYFLVHLQRLSAKHAQVESIDINSWRDLEYLDVSSPSIQLDSLQALRAERLSKLILDGISVQSVTDSLSSRLVSLTHLSLQECPNLTKVSFQVPRDNLPNLRYLFLDGCPVLSSLCVFGLRKLIHLSATNCPKLSTLFSPGPCLKTALFQGCTQLGANALTSFLEGAVSLQNLDLQGCSLIPEETKSLAESMPSAFSLCTALGLWQLLREEQTSLLYLKLAVSEHSVTFFSPTNSTTKPRPQTKLDLQRLALDLFLYPAQLSSLQFLDLSKLFHKTVPDSFLLLLLHRCPHLSELNLRGCHSLQDKSLLALTPLSSQLRYLNLSWCDFSEPALLHLFSHPFPQLLALSLSGLYNLTDRVMLLLSYSLISLESLNISSCFRVSDQSLLPLLRACPRLRRLDASGCYLLSDHSLSAIVLNCRYLQTLKLAECPRLSDSGLRGLFRAPQTAQLRILDLSLAVSVQTRSWEMLGRAAKSLRKLDLEDCSELTDQALIPLLQSCEQLMALNVKGCARIGDQSLEHVSMCTGLRELLVSDNFLYTDQGFQHLARHGQSLRFLWIRNCPRITNSTLLLLASSNSSLSYLFLGECPAITKPALDKFAWIRPDCLVFSCEPL